MKKDRILIKNGHIISPADGLDRTGDILIEDGLIAGIGPAAETNGFEGRLIDAGGCYVSPGFVDVHTHFRRKKRIYTAGPWPQRQGDILP